jgi:hypothetical protein
VRNSVQPPNIGQQQPWHTLATGMGLWRGYPIAVKAAYGVTAFMTIQAASVLAMGVVMLWRQDPTATPLLVFILAPVSVALAVFMARLLVSYATPPERVGATT